MKPTTFFIAATLFITGCKTLQTEIVINAPREKVWKEFTSFESYDDWNPFIKEVKTENGLLPKSGDIISIELAPDENSRMKFKPKIQEAEPYALRWKGHLLFPGIFDGHHQFFLEELPDGKTRFIQKEEFSGILLPLVPLDKTEQGFNNMNQALKKRVESEGRD